MMRFTTARVTLVICAAILSLQLPAGAQSNAPAERFIANAVNISEIGRTGATSVEIVIERWSAAAERDQLISTLLDKGPQEFLKALQKTKRVGFIREPTSLGYDLRLALQEPAEDGGRRIILATDRPIGFWEAVNQPRTINYPFTVIELHMKGNGEGEGKISLATRITGDKRRRMIELENYASQPVMLTQVRSAAH